MPLTLRNVSCWPANDASGRSSAVAEERTANVAPEAPALSFSNSRRTSASNAGGSGCRSIQARISAPASASARTSSVSSDARRAEMRDASPSAARKARNACAVVAKPPGTRTPASLSWLIISPREAFLPPTASTSVILRESNGATKAVARWVDDMGRLGACEKPASSDPCACALVRAAEARPRARAQRHGCGRRRGGTGRRARACGQGRKLPRFYEPLARGRSLTIIDR